MRFTIFAALAIAMASMAAANPVPMAATDENPTPVVKRAIVSEDPTVVPAPTITSIVDPSVVPVKTPCQKGCDQGYRNCIATGRMLTFCVTLTGRISARCVPSASDLLLAVLRLAECLSLR